MKSFRLPFRPMVGPRAVLQDQLQTGRTGGVLELVKAGLGAISTVRHMSTALFRLSQVAGRFWGPLGHVVKQLNHVLTGADLAWQAQIGTGLKLYHPTGVVIGPGVVAGAGLIVQQGVTIGGRGGAHDGSPLIGLDVVLGAGARILGPIVVGDGARIGANAVVLIDVGQGRTAVGIPARLQDRAKQTGP